MCVPQQKNCIYRRLYIYLLSENFYFWSKPKQPAAGTDTTVCMEKTQEDSYAQQT